MKKLFAFISVLAVAVAGLFADVTAKKLADGKVEATFFYGNPRATEVLVAGDFTNWQNGALPMTKTDKGFTLTKVFDAGTTVKYKFISDGNWTTDLKAPDFVDDGFGGKNSMVDLDSIAGGDAGATKYPNVSFGTWTMLGMQEKFSTQDKDDKTSKETNAENISVGFKSYNKLGGDLTGNMPFYIELVLAEQDYEDANVKLYDRANNYDDNVALVKHAFGDLFSAPQAYLAHDTKGDVATKNDGPTPTVPFAGHIKFGWNTPYVNYTTGYKYAKLPLRKVITWSTIADNWDAGYQNAGGYSLFENGEKLQQIGDYTINYGFNLNRSADRKGNNYGTYAFASLDTGAWIFDAQWNTMYGKDYQFYEPVENDIILGAKGKIGGVSLAVQGLAAIHNKSTEDLLGDDYSHAGGWEAAGYFGYSTDIFYRSGDFDGIENLAGNVQASWKNDVFSAKAEYRFRGAEASMLYIRNNHDDRDLKLYDMLGAPNSQRFTVDLGFAATEALSFGLNAYMETELKNYDTDSSIVKGVNQCWANNYTGTDHTPPVYTPIFLDGAGAEFEITPSVTYKFDEMLGFESSVNGYAIMDIASYKNLGAADDYEYSASDSKFLFKYAGVAFNAGKINDTIQGLDVYYGLDNSHSDLLGNTLVAKAALPADIEVSAGIGIRSVKNTDKGDAYDKDMLNPFGFGVGVSKKLKAIKSPKIYAQFVWNMDIYKGFGDGPTDLNLKNGANLGNWKYDEGLSRYDGAGALRVGMHWNF